MQPYTQAPPFYGQWGEDHWLATTFEIAPGGVFVDVGAGDGTRGSNSLYFENLGWRGLCVDADPRNHELLRRRHSTVEASAVSSTPGLRPFGMYAHKPSWSGLQRHGDDYQQIMVPCERLDTLLERARIDEIDLISIDVEGTELDVWDSFEPARHQPSIVIIEYDDTHPDRTRDTIRRHLGTSTYEVIHRTPANLILERTDQRWTRRP